MSNGSKAISGYKALGSLKRDRIGDQKNTRMFKELLSDSAAVGQFLYGQAKTSKTAWEEYDAGAKTINPKYESKNPHSKLDKTDFKLFDTDVNTTLENWKGQAKDIGNRFKPSGFQKPSEGFDFKGKSYDSSDIRAVGKLANQYDPKFAPHAKTLYDQWYGDDKNINPTNP